MFCHKCGQNLPENSLACFRCGVQFTRQFEPIQETPSQSKIEEKKLIIVNKTSPTVSLLGLLSALIFVGVCVVGFIAYQKYQRDKTIFGFSVTNDGINVTLPDFSKTSSPSSKSDQSIKSKDYEPTEQIEAVSKTIKFKKGKSSASYSGKVAEGNPDQYIFKAAAGQDVNISTVGNVYFHIYDTANNLISENSDVVLENNDSYTLYIISDYEIQDYNFTISIN